MNIRVFKLFLYNYFFCDYISCLIIIIMIFTLFYILSLIPRVFFIFLIDSVIYLRIYKISKSYKVTKINLKIAYPELSSSNIDLLSRRSIRESLVSGYETIYSWGRSYAESNNLIFKIENNFLLNRNTAKNRGLICVAIHNRSVDMLLTWINSQTPTVSLYKEIKNKVMESFVKNKREINNSVSVKTSISGVRTIFKALKNKKVICFAADQVPKRGLGEHINFYNKMAYTTTLVQNLASKTKCPTIYICMNSNINGFNSVSIKSCNDSIYDKSKHLHLVNKDIEQMINKRPVDYSWEYKRFKRSLPLENNPYAGI